MCNAIFTNWFNHYNNELGYSIRLHIYNKKKPVHGPLMIVGSKKGTTNLLGLIRMISEFSKPIAGKIFLFLFLFSDPCVRYIAGWI